MKNEYNEIANILVEKDISLSNTVLKSIEEFGELSKEVNRKLGIKRMEGLSDEDVNFNILDELTDTIQNLFSVGIKCGISYEEIQKRMQVKNKIWKNI